MLTCGVWSAVFQASNLGFKMAESGRRHQLMAAGFSSTTARIARRQKNFD